MKKSLFMIPVAALAFSACSNDTVVSENNTVNQPKEIAFSPIAQPSTRAAVEGTTFPTGQDIYVAAYNATKSANFFSQTTFDEDGSTGKWKASPAKYWPLEDATINFLAYTGITGGTFDSTNPASRVTIALSDNSTNQYDLMYACGRGSRTSGSSASDVSMNFKHAQALIKFTVQSAADYGTALKLTNIVLTGAHYSGTYTIDNSSNYNSTNSEYSATQGTWTSVNTQANVTRTPSWENDNKVTTTAQAVGEGILVVPDDNDETDDYTSFTINYTLDGLVYSYTYTPADLDVHQAKKYTFAITMTLNEIIIAPTVTDFVEENNNAVNVQ